MYISLLSMGMILGMWKWNWFQSQCVWYNGIGKLSNSNPTKIGEIGFHPIPQRDQFHLHLGHFYPPCLSTFMPSHSHHILAKNPQPPLTTAKTTSTNLVAVVATSSLNWFAHRFVSFLPPQLSLEVFPPFLLHAWGSSPCACCFYPLPCILCVLVPVEYDLAVLVIALHSIRGHSEEVGILTHWRPGFFGRAYVRSLWSLSKVLMNFFSKFLFGWK